MPVLDEHKHVVDVIEGLDHPAGVGFGDREVTQQILLDRRSGSGDPLVE